MKNGTQSSKTGHKNMAVMLQYNFFWKAGNMNEHRKNKMILYSEKELVLIEDQGICEAKMFSILL